MSAKHALRGAQEWLQGAVEAVRDAVLALRLDETLLRDAQLSAVSAADELEQLRQRIHAMRAFEERRARRFKDGKLSEWMRASGERAREAGRELEKTFVALREAMLERAPSEGSLVTRVLAALGFYVGKLENFLATWDLMLEEEVEGEIPVARWVELHDEGGVKDYLVCATVRPSIGATDRCCLACRAWPRAPTCQETTAHVVWVKLPFSVPDSALEEARREWIEGQGRSYFMEVIVPETAQRFKQGLGRLSGLPTIGAW